MRINAIYCINTNEILYSRVTHEYRTSEDFSCSIDGGFDYCLVNGNPEAFVGLELDGDYLLKFILGSDYRYANSTADKYPQGYHGRFKISKHSNLNFYKSLIVNYEDVEQYLNKVVGK